MLDSGPFGGIILQSKKKSKIPRLLPRTYLPHRCLWGRAAAGLVGAELLTTSAAQALDLLRMGSFNLDGGPSPPV